MKRTVRIGAIVLVLLAVAALLGVGRPERASTADTPGSGGITVTGTGSVTTVPDRAAFSFGVHTQAATASGALATNGVAMRKVIAALKTAGVAEADIQTQQVSLQPRTSQDGATIVGYAADNSVSAQVKQIDAAGAVIDAAVGAGANTVSGPSLVRSDSTALYRQALKSAVADAKAKAEALAAAGGVTLGRVTAIVEGGSGPPPLPFAADKAATPIEPGTQTISATVTVTYALS